MKTTRARILHVDDHQDTRLLMAALLGDCGYGVMTAGSIAEALALAREIDFDLFILDIRLPDGSGIDLCRSLSEVRPGTPVLYYSAYGDEAEHKEAVATCGDAYLKKPVSTDEMSETIENLLGGTS